MLIYKLVKLPQTDLNDMKNMDDNAIMEHIKMLTQKEEHLYGKENLSDEEAKELPKLKAELEQYWDLLRQRRALRDAGKNPDNAAMRSSDTIENYKE